MINNNYLSKQVLQKYQSLQSKADEREYFLELSLKENIEYSNVFYEYKATCIDYEKAVYFGKLDVEQLKKKKAELEKKLADLKKSLLPNTIHESYECKNCKDAGFDKNGNRCNCFYKNLSKLAYEFIGVKQPSFSSFDDDTLPSDSEQKPYLNKLKNYALGFSTDSKSLILLGNVGTGKTFLASAISNEVEKKNYNVIYLSACDFNQVLLNYHLAPSFDKEIYFDVLTSCDLLVIDDLGTEPIYKNVTIEYMLSVFSQRISKKLPFIITTNLSPEIMLKRYGERNYSRLMGKSVVKLQFKGKDLR